jgi:repressor LexA
MLKLTPRQQQILDFIQQSIKQSGMPPTRADMCQHFGFKSPTAAEDHLKALQRKGVIELLSGISRGIKVLYVGSDGQEHETGLPLIGQVAAGAPILAEENIEDYFKLDVNKFSPRADYLLRVRGQSMKLAGILDGDLLAVHRTQEAHNGQIVVARIGDEVTVKRFKKSGPIVHLVPENDEFEAIRIDLSNNDLADEFVIEGLGVGVIRHSL